MASTISLGGKGSFLSSSSVYKISTGDSSALERLLSTQNRNPKITQKKSLSLAIPQDLTIEELRASLAVLLHKLLLSPSSDTKIRTSLPVKISESLMISNSEKEALVFSGIDLTEGECDVLENSCASLIGICSVIEHRSTALSRIVDAVAALSCEAIKADITSFNSLDSEDGDAIAVASDLKVLLNGSNLLVGEEIEAVSKIPKIHGIFSVVVKNLRDVVRIGLNSEKFGTENKEVLGTRLLALSMAILNMGECSSKRTTMSYESIKNTNALRLWIFRLLCPSYETLEDSYKVAIEALLVDENYCKFAHLVNESLEILYRIVALEAFVAFYNLNGRELRNKTKIVGEANDEDEEEEEEEKAVLGKGTSILVKFIKDRLLGLVASREGVSAQQVMFLSNPEDPGVACFLDKVERF